MSPLESIIRQEMLRSGSISFARFMELALYCPKIGYYESGGRIGRKGDFYTSVSVGPLFGELLGRQFCDWAEPHGWIVEAAANDGSLAHDILSALPPARELKYAIVEPSERLRTQQQAKLAVFAGRVTWFASLDELPNISGVIFCNELLDAMPVHLLEWRRREWTELCVAASRESFGWLPARLEHNYGQPVVAPELAEVLPEGFRLEVSPAARHWWRAAASKLTRGKLIAIDYGYGRDEILMPRRAGGTLRAYCRHHLSDDVLASPGEQDITAHVNFDDIIRTGESAGLRTHAFTTQSQFLAGIAGNVSNWSSERVRQFQTLTHPEHLGRSFKVLIQSR